MLGVCIGGLEIAEGRIGVALLLSDPLALQTIVVGVADCHQGIRDDR
jgi:hypothetical protein